MFFVSRRRRCLVSFDGDIHRRSFLQFHLLAVLILQLIVDANFFVEFIGLVNFDLGFFRQARIGRLNNFLDRAVLGGFLACFSYPPP